MFTLAAPSIKLSPFTNSLGTYGYGEGGLQPYPFSVKPDRLLTVQDIYRMTRDQYEGTQFDLTNNTDAGPFGGEYLFSVVTIFLSSRIFIDYTNISYFSYDWQIRCAGPLTETWRLVV